MGAPHRAGGAPAGAGMAALCSRLPRAAYRALAAGAVAFASLEGLNPVSMAAVPEIPPVYHRLAASLRVPARVPRGYRS